MDLGFHPFVGLRYLRGPRHGWSRILLAITAFFVVAAITYLVTARLVYQPTSTLRGVGARWATEPGRLVVAAALILLAVHADACLDIVRSGAVRLGGRLLAGGAAVLGALAPATGLRWAFAVYALVWLVAPWLPSRATAARRRFLRFVSLLYPVALLLIIVGALLPAPGQHATDVVTVTSMLSAVAVIVVVYAVPALPQLIAVDAWYRAVRRPTVGALGEALAASASAAAVLAIAPAVLALARPASADGFVLETEVLGKYMVAAQLAGVIALIGAVLFGTILVLRRYFSFYTTVSIAGVLLGSTALVVVLSVMTGFETDLRSKILGSNAHIQISREDGGDLLEWEAVRQRVERVPGVVASTPFAVSEVVIAANNNYFNVIIKGIDAESVGRVTELVTDIQDIDKAAALARLEPLVREAGIDLEVPVGSGTGAGAGSGVLDPPPPDLLLDGPDPIDLSGDPSTAGSGAGGPATVPGEGDADPAVDDDDDDDDAVIRGVTPTVRDPFGGDAARVLGLADADPGTPTAAARDDAGEPAPPTLDPPPPDLDIPDEEPIDYSAEGSAEGAITHVIEVGPDALPLSSRRTQTLHGVLVGSELAKQIHLYVGQEVRMVSPLSDPSNPDATGTPIPFNRDYRIAATFFTGMYEYDLKFVYVSLESLQEFLDRGDGIDGLEVRITQPDATGPVVAALGRELGPDYRVQDWRELNRSLFSALKLEKIAMFLVLGIVILVASFSIIGNLIMVVVEKGKEIALLKTLGARDRSVVGIFVLQGLFIGVIGTAIGLTYGLTLSWVFAEYGIPIDPNVYYMDKLPIHVDGTTVALVGVAGAVISVLATVYPALVAARLRPSVGLRH